MNNLKQAIQADSSDVELFKNLKGAYVDTYTFYKEKKNYGAALNNLKLAIQQDSTDTSLKDLYATIITLNIELVSVPLDGQ